MHQLHTIQRLPISLQQAWEFFSTPKNLQAITPDYLNFTITSSVPETMYPGTIITYKVHPVAGIPINWVTEITHVENLRYFVDEQRFGPYKFWHHKHFFKEIPGGVEMQDLVHYALPFGILGNAAHALFVKRQLESIFSYRYKVLSQRFGAL